MIANNPLNPEVAQPRRKSFKQRKKKEKRPEHDAIYITDGVITFALGNSKIPTYEIALFTMVPVVTCPGAGVQGCGAVQLDGSLLGDCFMIQLMRRYPSTYPAWKRNTVAAAQPDFPARLSRMFDTLVAYRKVKIKAVRAHIAGDVFSQEYLDAWIDAAIDHPQLQVWFYTKSLYDFKGQKLDYSRRPPNMLVYLSDDELIWRDHWDEFDGTAIIESPVEGALACPDDCSQCSYCFEPRPAGEKRHINWVKHAGKLHT